MRLRYLVPAMALFAATACVDEEFQLDKASSQVTIGGDVTTLPLGYLEKQRLGDFITIEDVEGLNIDANGNYSLSFDGDGDEISIDGIENSFDIEKTVTTFSADYPAFDLTGGTCSINETFSLTPDFGELNLPQNVSIPVPAGYTITSEQEGELSELLQYSVPEYLSAIKRIYFKPQKSGEKGARIDLTLNLGDLSAVNGGGHVNLELMANEGYELYDANGRALKATNIQGGKASYQIADGYTFASGAKEIKFTVYVASIANASKVTNKQLSIPVELGYNVDFDITTKSSSLTFNNKPQLSINASFQYQDADIVLNEVVLLEHGALADAAAPIAIDNLPKEVKSVKKITFSDNSPIHFLSEGLDWLDDATAEHIIIEAQLPEYLTLHDAKQQGYDATTHTLRTNLSDLRKSILINLDALTFSGEGVVPQNGEISLDFAPDIAVYIEEGTETKLSKVLHGDEIEFSAGFDNTTLELVSVEGKIAYTYEETTTIEMGGVEDIDLSIKNAGVSPIITINVENPLTLEAKVSALLTPVFDGVAKNENSVSIDDVVIKAATVVNGNHQNTPTTLILADESLRGNYSDAKYTFVACDLGKLIAGNIPDEVVLNIAFSTDENAMHTIYVEDSFVVKYSYDVNIPLAFNDKLDITVESTADGLADTFADLADQDISVQGISLIADVVNTIPLDFAFEAEFLNAQGQPTEAKLDIPAAYSKIKGSSDGKSEAKSTLRIGLDLGKSGNINKLADVDAIRFALKALRSSDGSCSLNADQYIALNLKFEIKGKIKVDLDNVTE